MADKAAMIADRDAGMTYQAIADKHGVSHQYVSQVCGRYSPKGYRPVTETGCVYPNWRRWMNENKISRNELLRRMGLAIVIENSERLRRYMRGEGYPRKDYIDRLLAVTGMSYECLFDDRLWEG